MTQRGPIRTGAIYAGRGAKEAGVIGLTAVAGLGEGLGFLNCYEDANSRTRVLYDSLPRRGADEKPFEFKEFAKGAGRYTARGIGNILGSLLETVPYFSISFAQGLGPSDSEGSQRAKRALEAMDGQIPEGAMGRRINSVVQFVPRYSGRGLGIVLRYAGKGAKKLW